MNRPVVIALLMIVAIMAAAYFAYDAGRFVGSR